MDLWENCAPPARFAKVRHEQGARDIMKSALMAVAITALMGGLVIGPVTQQSAEAQVYGGLKSAGTTGGAIGENNLILVGHGGGHGGGHWGGGHGGGHVAHGGGRGGHGHGGRA
jgi:hypothetical protein